MFTEEIQSLLKSPENFSPISTIQGDESGKKAQFAPTSGHVSSMSGRSEQSRQSFSHEQVKLLSDLKFSIGVQIGGLNVTAHQLLDLSPNQFFEFELNPYTKLSLFIEGEKIATAKFISVNDKLGLEIVEVKN